MCGRAPFLGAAIGFAITARDVFEAPHFSPEPKFPFWI